MKKIFPTWCILLLLFFSLSNLSFSQDSSSTRLRISLITCSPGNELYSIFGHSAIRVVDSNSVSDIVFNYGTFNFDEDFYLKFVQGKLNYYLSAANVNDFLFEYIATGRGVSEQVLDLSPQEKASIFHYLLENIKEENKFYQYDFFYNNCTTRLRDIVLNAKENKPILPFVMNNKSSFRDAIHLYLRKGQQYWSELGIDLLLGVGCDKIMTAEEQEFLPNNLMNAFDGAENNRIVKNRIELYSPSEIKNEKVWLTPFLLFTFVLLLYILFYFIKNKTGLFFLNCFDFLLYFITGVLGVVFVCMWFFTDHTMTKYNFNLLWAFPFNIFACFFIKSKQKIAKLYFLVYAISNALILILWEILPQQLHYSLVPIVIMLGFSAYSNFKKMEKFIEKNQSIIYYSLYGQGMPVLMLHGYGLDSSIWHSQIESLKEKYLFIVPDLPGFGKSKTNFEFDYSFDAISDILQAILLKESITKCIFIGHSMGGYIGLNFLKKYPGNILGLGLFHSTAYIDSELKKEKRFKSIEFIKKNGAAPFIEMLTPSLFNQKSNHITDIEKLIQNTSTVKEDVLIGYYHAMLNRDENLKLLINENMPYLFVAGLNDELIPLKEILQQCHLPKQAEIYILQSSGHMGMMEEKEKTTELLDNYFKQIQNKQDE